MNKKFIVLFALLFISLFAYSEDISKECFTCHNDEGMAKEKNSGGSLSDLLAGGKEELTLFVKNDDLKGTPHEGFSCADCHSDIKELPHNEKLSKVNCAQCHDDAESALKKGVHSKDGKNKEMVPGCPQCHGAHKILPKSDPDSPVARKNLLNTCGVCHSDAEKMAKLGVYISNPVKNYSKSNHAKAIAAGNDNGAVCSSCHGYHEILASSDPASPISKKNISKTCGKCHGDVQKEYSESIHGVAADHGVAESPTCTNCHSEHDIEGPENEDSTVNPAYVAERTCAPCHSSVTLSKRFGIPTDRIETFKGSFHGLATKYGDTRVANCASCHGVHNIFPSSDPRSSINPVNLKNTCGKCHPNATDAFAKTKVHLSAPASNSKILFWLRYFYIFLIISTIGGMIGHHFLDYLRRYIETVKKLRLVENYVRMDVSERWQHLALITSFFALVITGFALKYPDSVFSYPFKFIPRGNELRGLLHRIAAVVMIAGSFYHLIYLAATKRGRELVIDMIPKLKDVTDVLHQIGYYFGYRREGAQFDRFSYAEKMEYLALIWGTIVMVATGFILWFKTFFTQYMPDWGYPAAEMIHFYEAVLATLSIIIWHLYAVFTHTKYPPFNTTVFTGKMTKDEIEHQHPAWLDKLEREKAMREAEKEKEEKEKNEE
jgi:cytochrome b subunit of formate dehydrogenase